MTSATRRSVAASTSESEVAELSQQQERRQVVVQDQRSVPHVKALEFCQLDYTSERSISPQSLTPKKRKVAECLDVADW